MFCLFALVCLSCLFVSLLARVSVCYVVVAIVVIRVWCFCLVLKPGNQSLPLSHAVFEGAVAIVINYN
jgi:hypothetical protein